ncbi:zinc ribbon domain-containing protein [Paenibacillus sp. NFR01]|uniref:zinc ribbon domain-containing protein n=1 Tax=Paenibacillus sp. NFR01 TaxID=1566279 RepID=UPI0008CC254B|nr:zinc ribbon domain-containing protein [Paenibacillus sp. NFR01]SEU17573.1 hypothetical protein SAMN03159358_3683 [Paenibacillus sp. NFR01]
MSNLPKYERNGFDIAIIVFAYLFMPLGLVFAMIQLSSTHYKNYRKPVNYNLLFHVFLGGFVEILVPFIGTRASGDITTGQFVMTAVLWILLFLVPAAIFARSAARARGRFLQLAERYIQLITGSWVRHIGDLSDMTGQSEADVSRDIEYLKSHGVLDADIAIREGRSSDAAEGRPQPVEAPHSPFGAPGGQPYPQPTSSPLRSQPPASRMLPKSVSCPSCGAQNTVTPDQPKSCDYCGTALSYH